MTYEHQERYRRRTLLKAKYFDQANAQRMHRLRVSARHLRDAAPEVRACVPFFLSHPEATYIPSVWDSEDLSGWEMLEVRGNRQGDADFHLALGFVALTSVSKLPVRAEIVTDSGTGVIDDTHPDVIRVRKEIEELRACGMWVTE